MRLDILFAIDEAGRASPSSIAGTNPDQLPNLSYHVRELHAVGLLRRAGTRQVRGAIENFYELTDEGKAAIDAIDAIIALDPKRPKKRGR